MTSSGGENSTERSSMAATRPIDRPIDEISADGEDDEASLPPGAEVGRYTIIDRIGHGGMGDVYLARDPKLRRKVAIKLVRLAGLRRDVDRAAAEAQLVWEAQAMAHLAHANVLPVHDVEVARWGIFIVMEYVAGETLTKWLAATERSWRDILRVFLEAGRGLAAAHGVGLVHRDFKPGNVLVGNDGRIRVTDFGLAGTIAPSTLESSGSAAEGDRLFSAPDSLSRKDGVLGTPAFMPPTTDPDSDPRSDQFSYCVALFHALYGLYPFAGKEQAILDAAKAAGMIPEPPADTKAPGWLYEVVARGLRPRIEERWPSMDALLHALEDDLGARILEVLEPLLGRHTSRRAIAIICERAGKPDGMLDSTDRDIACKTLLPMLRTLAGQDVAMRVIQALEGGARS
jgi:serine/threonine protein kinase